MLTLAAGVAVALFAIAFFAAGGGASDKAPQPAGEVRIPAPEPAQLSRLRSIGTIPPAPAPRRPKKKKKTPKATPSAPATRPPAVITPPPPPPPPPPAPRPPPPSDPGCVGALCP